jgi:hypothetical protein
MKDVNRYDIYEIKEIRFLERYYTKKDSSEIRLFYVEMDSYFFQETNYIFSVNFGGSGEVRIFFNDKVYFGVADSVLPSKYYYKKRKPRKKSYKLN